MTDIDSLAYRLRRVLALDIADGTEAHDIVDDLVAAVCDARNDPIRIASARTDAKVRLRALTVDRVPVEGAIDAVVRLHEDGTI